MNRKSLVVIGHNNEFEAGVEFIKALTQRRYAHVVGRSSSDIAPCVKSSPLTSSA